MYLLSIIIPLYNASKVIKNTLDNLLLGGDLFTNNVELLLVDDGSKDDTEEVVKEYVKKYQNIIYFKKENEGVAKARNFGVNHASGKYLFFHDQDDVFEISNLEKILNILKNGDSNLYLFNADQIIDGNRKDFVVTNPSFEGDQKEIRESLFRSFSWSNSNKGAVNLYNQIWSVIIDRDFFIKNNCWFERFVAFEDDFICLLKVLVASPKVFISDLTIYHWIITSSSYSHSYVYDGVYLSKLPNYLSFLHETLSHSEFNEIKDSFLSVLERHKYLKFVLWFSNNRKGRKEFVKLCRQYDVGKHIADNSPVKERFRSKVINSLFRSRMYSLIYFLYRNKKE